MRILGIDPGLATLGYGVIDTQGSKITLITAGAVITPPDMITPDRLVKIRCDIRELLTVYQPQEIAFEELFFSKNITTGMNVSRAGLRCAPAPNIQKSCLNTRRCRSSRLLSATARPISTRFRKWCA